MKYKVYILKAVHVLSVIYSSLSCLASCKTQKHRFDVKFIINLVLYLKLCVKSLNLD